MGLLVLAVGAFILCLASSTAVHEFIVETITGVSS